MAHARTRRSAHPADRAGEGRSRQWRAPARTGLDPRHAADRNRGGGRVHRERRRHRHGLQADGAGEGLPHRLPEGLRPGRAFRRRRELLWRRPNFEILTAFGPRTDFRNYLNEHWGEDWIAGALAHPSLKRDLADGLHEHLPAVRVRPGRPRQALYFFKDAKEKTLKNLDAATTDLMANDRVLMAYTLLEEYDFLRTKIFKTLDECLRQARHQGGHADSAHAGLATDQQLPDGFRQPQVAQRDQGPDARADADDRRGRRPLLDAGSNRCRAQYAEAISKMGFGVLEGLAPTSSATSSADSPTFKPLHDLLNGLTGPDGLYSLDAAGALQLPERG